MRRRLHADHRDADAGLSLTAQAGVLASYLRARVLVARRYEASSLPELLDRLDRRPTRPRRSVVDLERGIRLGERVARRLHLGPDTCLYRSLARYATVRASGHDARFVMAVDRDDAGTGHAWVELEGRPLFEGDLSRYLRTLEHPARDGRRAASHVEHE